MKKTIIFMIVGLLASSACIAQQNIEEMTKKSLQDQPSAYKGFEDGRAYFEAKDKSEKYKHIYELYSNLKDDDVFNLYVHGVERGSKRTFPWDSTSLEEHRSGRIENWYTPGVVAGEFYIQKRPEFKEEDIINDYNNLDSFGKMVFKRGVIKGSKNQFPPWKVSDEEYSKLSSVSNDLKYEDPSIDYYNRGAEDGREYSKLYKQYMTHPDNRRYKASKESKEDLIKNSYKGFKNENKKAYQQGVMENLKEGAYILWPLDRNNNDKYYYQKHIMEMYDREGKGNAFFQFLYMKGINSESLWIIDQESYNKGEKDGQEYTICYKECITGKKKIPTLYLKEDLIKRFYRKLAKNPNDYREGVIKGLEETPFAW